MSKRVHIIQAPPHWLKSPPLSVISLSSYLKSKNIQTEIIDLNHLLFRDLGISFDAWLSLDYDFEQDLWNLVEKKAAHTLDALCKSLRFSELVGFSLLKRNTSFTEALSSYLRIHLPHLKFIFGGPQTLLKQADNFTFVPDYYVVGEGETALLEIANGSSKSLYRFLELEDLDTLPFYDFGPLLPKNYSVGIPLITSRGCPHRCSFCTERLLVKHFRHHSPGYVADHIDYLIKRYNTSHFVFCDSLLNYNPFWLDAFCRILIERKTSITWEAQMRIQPDFSRNLALTIKQSGCINLFIGFESGSDKVLSAMHKDVDTGTALSFFKIINSAGLHFELSIIVGHPSEAEADFIQTCEFLRSNKKLIPKIAQVNPYINYYSDNQSIFPSQTAKLRARKLAEILISENIRFTKKFINNLIYA